METINRINIRGSMLKMSVSETLEFPRPECNPNSVRTISSLIKTDTGKAYTVLSRPEKIVVTRIS
jgi:hypothetical protein